MSKILLIGPIISNSPHSAEGGVYDALHELGHDTVCYDPRVNKIVHGPDMNSSEFVLFDEFAHQHSVWDVILCLGPGLPPKLYESGILNLVEGFKICWNSEPIRLEHYYDRVIGQSKSFDMIATFDESEIQLYKNAGCNNVIFLPQGYNPKNYTPLHNDPGFDFSFVGSIGGKWQNREPFLRNVISICEKNQWTLNIDQTFDSKEVNRIYNNSKVILNLGLYHQELGNADNMKSFGLQQRIFEAYGSGRVTLTHSVDKHTNQIFKENENIVFYDGLNNLEHQMQYSMNHWQEFSDNIIKTSSDHNYKSRMKRLLDLCLS